MAQLACQLKSLHATHIVGDLNHIADSLSLKTLSEGSERQTVKLILSRCGQAQIDLFALLESTYCLLWYSHTRTSCLTAGPRSYKYALPPVSLIAQTLCKVRQDREQILFVAPYWPNQTWFSELVLLASAYPWWIPLRRYLLSQGKTTIGHSRPDLWNLNVCSLDATLFIPGCPGCGNFAHQFNFSMMLEVSGLPRVTPSVRTSTQCLRSLHE